MAAIPYMVYGICGICSFYCFRVAEGVCSVGIGGCGCYFVVIYYSDGYKAVKVVVGVLGLGCGCGLGVWGGVWFGLWLQGFGYFMNIDNKRCLLLENRAWQLLADRALLFSK